MGRRDHGGHWVGLEHRRPGWVHARLPRRFPVCRSGQFWDHLWHARAIDLRVEDENGIGAGRRPRSQLRGHQLVLRNWVAQWFDTDLLVLSLYLLEPKGQIGYSQDDDEPMPIRTFGKPNAPPKCFGHYEPVGPLRFGVPPSGGTARRPPDGRTSSPARPHWDNFCKLLFGSSVLSPCNRYPRIRLCRTPLIAVISLSNPLSPLPPPR